MVQDRRFEYFRGKDFAIYFKQHPAKFADWIPDKSGQSRSITAKTLILRPAAISTVTEAVQLSRW